MVQRWGEWVSAVKSRPTFCFRALCVYSKSADTALNAATIVRTGAINKQMLGQDVLTDLNATIGMNRLSSEIIVKLDQNVSGGAGVVAGSLISVCSSLYQRGEPKELVWEEKAPVSVARLAFDGVEVLDGKIYFVGGNNGSELNIAERYDPETNSWEAINPLSVGRGRAASATLEGKFYIFGGSGKSSVEIFNRSTDSWTTGISLPNILADGTAISVNGKIYLNWW